ncbi:MULTISPECIES: hypothetical protein [Chryseobacterium]|uniref:Uncharacterized protein n=1 Tax=Chryseobacterium camelliae TaxID=1265445 RepID=A0ABU0TND5_9FLAO|nr:MULTISPECIES: hypothetical protein [Chryseobacterium]MDT3407588.1 hypothetical protein [Pseudacidovorax intermedius]MDQ1098559.1 hypothetical protein [Chryseobacterium camelliae]MDQ1102483.1 hypothetical protein [Chryseobacterium sp. SORGH_AS_1048]MDR6085917.1 hypothetical protein [Chryseobacterium sp. SORGH_AS_0909]MDR6130283.1 hypothetical protein [Chryseobacterium sp. SORGH_AS_1175]
MKKIFLSITLSSFAFIYSQVGINTSNPQGIFHVDGAKDNAATGMSTSVQQANDFVVTSNGSVGIGTNLPDSSAILDVSVDGLEGGNKKGFLGPKAALSSQTDQVTIPSPATGLLVYNQGTGGLTYNGYVFWNGSEWRTLSNASLAPGTIGAITCNAVNLSPATYTAGVSYTGTLIVPYTGGNGGVYGAQSIGSVNGLTATLLSGNFNSGSGTLSYEVSGTPTVSSPVTTTFALNIGGQSCNATVGAGDGIALGELIYYKTSIPATPAGIWLSAYAADLPVLGGKLRLDAYFNANSSQGNGAVTMYPRIVNTSSSPVKLWFSALSTVDRFNAGNYLLAPSTATGSGTSLAPSAYVELDNGIYYNLGFNDILGTSTPRTTGSGAGANQEVLTVDLSLDDKWYRIYYFPIVDNKNTATTNDDTREIYLSIQRLY